MARRAVEWGVTLIDTAHLYGGGANEELLAEALYPYPGGLVITTKVGVARSGPGGEWKQVALAWLLGRSPVVLPIPATARVDHLAENLAAEELRLTPAQRTRLDGLAVTTRH